MAVLHGLDQALQLVGVPDDDGLRVSPASYSATVEAKSAAGKRGLPMSATVAKALKAFQTLQKKERLKVGDAYVDMGYVLVDELGQPQRTDWLRRRCTS